MSGTAYNPDDNVFTRVDKAFQEIATVGLAKNKTAGTESYTYKFIPISDILNVVRAAHSHFGVKVIPSRIVFDKDNFEGRELINGKLLANGHIVFRIVGKDMEDSFEASVSCEALDNSDKLTNKLVTNAERCLYRMMYALDEGDDTDPEALHIQLTEEPKTKPAAKRETKDSFFTKKPTGEVSSSTKGASQSFTSASPSQPVKSDLDTILDAESDPRLKEMVTEWKRKNNILTLYETLPEQRAELANMVRSVA